MCASSLVWHSQWHLTEGPCYQRAVKVISHRRCHVFFFFLSLFLTLRHKDFTELRCCGLLSLWLFLFPQQPKKVLDSQNTALNEFLCILSFWIEHFYQGDFFFFSLLGNWEQDLKKRIVPPLNLQSIMGDVPHSLIALSFHSWPQPYLSTDRL